MGNVLTTASTVTCGHVPEPLPPPPPPGTPPPPVPGLVATSSEEKLKVEGHPVLVRASLLLKDVSNCPNTASGSPCLHITTVLSGESAKLKAGGKPVMLDVIGLQTDGLPPPPVLRPKPNQSKLTSL